MPFKIIHRIAEKMHALHLAHKTHSALADEEEKRKKIVRNAKEKNWPQVAGKKTKQDYPAPETRNTRLYPRNTEPLSESPKQITPTRPEQEKQARHKLLLSHFATHLKKQKEAA